MEESRSEREREQAAQLLRGLQESRPLTIEEALDLGLQGWNLRCNRCGSHGASWMSKQRPGWGDMALCALHRAELSAELRRHEQALRELRAVHFEQRPRHEIDRDLKAYNKARKAAAKSQ